MEAPRGAGATLQGVAPVRVVAALFVAKRGCYFNLPNVEPWDKDRDARNYQGPHPVVAHPPCERWGRYWHGGPSSAKFPRERKIKGDDGGCFAAALAAVRRWGGVLEHPEASAAWDAFGIARPMRSGGWQRDLSGGWTCCVEQGHYGHRARKATWLYACVERPPVLVWGRSAATARLDDGYASASPRAAARAAMPVGPLRLATTTVERLSHKERAATPIAFRDMLLAIARSA